VSSLVTLKKKIGFVSGIAIFVVLMVAPLPVDVQIKRTLAVLALCAVWWGTEAISIYATSLVPAVLLPLLGILPLQETLSSAFSRFRKRSRSTPIGWCSSSWADSSSRAP